MSTPSPKRDSDARDETSPAKMAKVEHQGAATPSLCAESQLLKALQQKLVALKDAAPEACVGSVYQIPLQKFAQEVAEVLNTVGKKLGRSPGNMAEVSPLQLQFEDFVRKLIEVDLHFKVNHPEKLAMWMSHGWVLRPKDLGIPHRGGLVDVVLMPNDFCIIVIQCTGHVPISLYTPLVEHLDRYYRNLQKQPHVSLKCIAGEILDLKTFCCGCATCKRICNFYGLQHDTARLVINSGDTGPEHFDQIAQHIFDTKVGKEQNLDLKDDLKPKTLATAKRKKELVFAKDGSKTGGLAILLHKLKTFQTEIQKEGNVGCRHAFHDIGRTTGVTPSMTSGLPFSSIGEMYDSLC